MHELPKVAAFELAPDWVCEIISPNSARYDRIKKPRIYVNEGVEWLWIIDPEQKTLEVMQLQATRCVQIATHEESEVVRVPPFEAVELQLETWWI